MARFILFLILMVPLVLAGNWLLANPGEVNIHWFGYDITLHVAVVALALLMFGMALAFITSLMWQLASWPERRRARRQYRTMAKGLAQLTRGVTALSLGDEAGAQVALKKALAALPHEPLPQLLSAQLLQRQGKHDQARVHLNALMRHEITAPLATRKLIEQHLARAEYSSAIHLAETAHRDAPKDRWLALTLIDLYAREKNPSAMLALTEGWQWQSPLSKEERHRFAALAHYIAAQADETPRVKEQHLRHAVGYAPDFQPAAIAYAELLLAQGETKRARKWLRETWDAAPSLLLIAPILKSIDGESPRGQARYLKPFMKGSPHVVRELMAARQAMNVGEPELAKVHALKALELEECKESLAMMAEVEKELNGSVGANPWLAQAMDAPHLATWVCLTCGTTYAQWQAHCDSCQSFDSLRYERPEARITSVEVATV